MRDELASSDDDMQGYINNFESKNLEDNDDFFNWNFLNLLKKDKICEINKN